MTVWAELAARAFAGLLFLSGLSLCAAPALPSFFIRTWQTQEGLPHNAVTAILQTHDGYLWLGTYDGLARFDGASFTVFDNNSTPEMSSSRVISLFEDNAGTLWIGHETGELTRYRDGHFHSVQFNPSWESRKVIGIGAGPTGDIWALNSEGRIAGLNGEIISGPNAGTSTAEGLLFPDRHGALSMMYGGEIFRLDRKQLVSMTHDPQELGYIEAICPSHDGAFWIISNGRIRKWNGQDWTDDLGPCPWPAQSSVTTLIETRSGCVAVGTLAQGLYLVFPHRGVLHYNRSNGFPHDWVRSLCEDREGTLWAGTGSAGLVALRAGKVTTVDPPDHWLGSVVLSVAAAHDGALWIGTEGAGLYRFQDGDWARFGETNGLSNLFVWSVSEDAQGRLWAGTWGGGVFIKQNGHFDRVPGLEQLSVPTPAILHAHDGVTWVGTGVGLLRYDNGAISWYGAKEGLVLPDVRAVVEGRDGELWFGMLGGGLGRLRDGMVQQFRKRDGLASDYVQCLHFDADGALWIGTYGGGLNRLKQGRFASISTRQGLPNNFICDIKEDDHGNFWLSSHGGIFRIQRGELNRCADGQSQTLRTLSYGKGDGMPTLECSGGLQPPGCKTADGRLWFPTSKGLVVVDPDDAKANQLPPPVLIEKMLVEGNPVDLTTNRGSPLVIRPGQQRFDFQYTALSFVAPEKIRFHTRLVGSEPEWVDAGTERAAKYSHLTPGDYTFRVIAANSDGVPNDIGASLAFTVRPYFWQEWWFRALEGLIAAALLTGVVVLAMRRRMRLKLERLERQRAIERERARIAQDIHDNLGANLTRISLLSQAAHGELDNPAQAATQLDRIYSTARELTRAMDEIVWAVNPHHDSLDSLASYLGNFAQEFLVPLGVRCRLDVPMQLPHWPVTAEVRHNLFLAFKEALHNVVKHANASEVFITLIPAAKEFTLLARDNGVGFTLENPEAQKPAEPVRLARGNGLANMRRRLEKIGGRCEIETAPGKGTEVRFVVPVVANVSGESA
jgi:signal transduction histidine kinase/ligand-binding sensor domain-containing protein